MIDVKAQTRTLRKESVAPETLSFLRVEDDLLYTSMKRVVDILLSAILLLLFAPLMAMIAMAVRLDSPGPAIFRQRRVGQNGREFVLYKFRSMYHNADENIHRMFARRYIRERGETDEQGRYKPKADPRVTRVGHLLRLTSLDELPQLWNVLRGDMSLVGPRPAMRYEVDEYERWQLQRLAVLPGLTGLAQISGRSGLTFEKIARLDLAYIEERSFWVDLKILLLTLPVVLLAKCAG